MAAGQFTMIFMSPTHIGRYEIQSTLGRGAMGVVYLALDPIIDRKVALKTMRVDLDAEHAGEFRERFVREARAAGRLNHPGIVTVHDVGEDPESGLMYIAMEYVEGQDLKSIASEHRFRPSEAARIASDVATALDYAHGLGVIHRDIKPANIILTPDGSAKITDFGIARFETSNLTVDGQFIGTPNFMSPEQITGRQVDGRSDLFSLGVVLFSLLTGRRPFVGDTMHEVTLRIVQEPSPIPSTLSDEIPAALNPIVLKCLEKNPDKRFQTGRELARVLAAVAGSLVDREPDDKGSTGVFQPDLETRIHGESPTAESGPGRARSPASVFSLWKRIPMPEWLQWEIDLRWFLALSAAMVLILVLTLTILRSTIDRGPFAAPSLASTKNLNGVVAAMDRARSQLAAGQLDAAEASAMAAVDQAPTSPKARELAQRIHRAVEEQRTSAANQLLVAELIEEGRRLYRREDYPEAAAQLREALELDPKNEVAASYLDLSLERMRARSSSRSNPSSTRGATGAVPTTEAPPLATPTAGIARLTLSFDSPVSSGTILITLDGESLSEIPFDFSAKAFLGFRRKGTGTIKRVVLTPSGRHQIGVQLMRPQQGLLGSKEFGVELAPDSLWSLRIDMPSATAAPNFFLVQSAR